MKAFFNNLAKKREKKRKYKQLAAAIKAGDLDDVRAALKDGADAGFFPGDTKKMPLSLALEKGDAAIFKELMETPGGQTTLAIWHYDFRALKVVSEQHRYLYFLPSFLYAAIEQKKEDIALLLLKSPFASYDNAGQLNAGELLANGSIRLENSSRAYALLKKPIDLARENGLMKVVAAIEEKTGATNIERLEKLAAEKKAEAEALLREAEKLRSPTGETLKPPSPSPGGFRL